MCLWMKQKSINEIFRKASKALEKSFVVRLTIEILLNWEFVEILKAFWILLISFRTLNCCHINKLTHFSSFVWTLYDTNFFGFSGEIYSWSDGGIYSFFNEFRSRGVEIFDTFFSLNCLNDLSPDIYQQKKKRKTGSEKNDDEEVVEGTANLSSPFKNV